MAKHIRDKSSSTSEDGYSPPAKSAKATCEYCSKEFTSRGLPRHAKKCKEKLDNEKAQAKKTRSYKFCFVNEPVHEEILSFLSNQNLTKMQLVTGDHYKDCEPKWARCCCKCENDQITIPRASCRVCTPTMSFRYNYAYEKEARNTYGLSSNDYGAVPHEQQGTRLVFERDGLVNYALKKFGSELDWKRHVGKIRGRKEKTKASRLRLADVRSALQALPPAFNAYVSAADINKLDEKQLKQWHQRFVALTEALQARGLSLERDSTLCKDFIKTGRGRVEDVVDAIADLEKEEK